MFAVSLVSSGWGHCHVSWVSWRFDVLARISRLPTRPSYALPLDDFNEQARDGGVMAWQLFGEDHGNQIQTLSLLSLTVLEQLFHVHRFCRYDNPSRDS